MRLPMALRGAFVPLVLALPLLGGEVIGHVVITKPVARKRIAPIAYNLRAGALPDLPAVQETANEFDRIILMLEGPNLRHAPPVSVVMEQKGGRFLPELVIVPVGSTVQFPNFDPIFHNVFSLSRTHSFDLGFYPEGQSRVVRFDRAGVVQVYCHIHANMYGAIVVTPSPWFAKPGPDGSFSWPDVPAGHYRLVAWHKVAGSYYASVDVPQKGKAEVNVHVPIDVVPTK